MMNSTREFLEQIPPHSMELELALVGGLMTDPTAMESVAPLLSADAFYDPKCRKIYKAIWGLFYSNRPTDFNLVAAALTDSGDIKAIGGSEGLVDIQFMAPLNIDCRSYATRISEYATRRLLIEALRKGLAIAYDNSLSLEQVCDESEALVYAATQSRVNANNNSPVILAELLDGAFGEIERRSQGAALPGVPCGFNAIDDMTQGFQRSDLIIIAGRPSMGKTSFALNIAHNVAAHQNLPVAVFSMEMSKEQIANRFLSTESRVPSGRLRSGRVTPGDWEPIGLGIGALSHLPLFVDDSKNSVAEMQSKIRRLHSEVGQLGLVVIDYVQLMGGGGGGGGNRVQELSAITRDLKGMARELNVPVIALSQLSRGVESRTDKRPMMSDLKESGSLEQDADVVAMLYRDEYYNPNTPERGIAEVIICKHRNGPVGTVKLLFEPQFTQFRNLARS